MCRCKVSTPIVGDAPFACFVLARDSNDTPMLFQSLEDETEIAVGNSQAELDCQGKDKHALSCRLREVAQCIKNGHSD